MFKKAYISCDHAGSELVTFLINEFKNQNIEFVNLEHLQADDYTDVAKKVVSNLKEEPESIGILICGSGVGVSIVANRFAGVRAALCHSVKVAELSRKHNDANVLCLGARMMSFEEQVKIVKAFIETEFEGGRHETRIKKIDNNY